MHSKYLFLLLLGASVLGAWFVYGDGVSFSTSDAAGYAVSINHINGPRAIMIGETVRLEWPYTYRGTSDSPVTISLHHEFASGDTEVAVIGRNITGRRFRWTAGHECCKAGLPAGGGNYLGSSFVITKGTDNNIYSEQFNFIEKTEYPIESSDYIAQILALQAQVSALQNELVENQSTIDGLLGQIAQLQLQLYNLTK